MIIANRFQASVLSAIATITLLLIIALSPQNVQAAACVAPTTDYGSATYSTLDITATGTYEVQARMQASSTDANANSFMLEIDGNTCMVIGDHSSISGSEWTWVDYKDGNTGTKATHNFTTTGNHTIKLIGREAGVKLDRVIFTVDGSCVPSGTGDNCAEPPDDTPPAVTLTQPAANATVEGQVAITANASDVDSGISKVQFYSGSSLIGEDSTSPYSVNWDTTTVANGSYNLTARATNGQGLVSTSSVQTVTVYNPPQFSCAGSSVLLCQDFNAALTGFTTTGGTWGSASGKLTLSGATTSGGVTGNLNTAVHSQAISGNYDYTIEGMVVGSTTGSTLDFDDFSVIFNYQDAQNYYYASFNESNDGNTNGIFHVAGGVQTELFNFADVIQDDTTYDVKITKRDSTYKVYLDGKELGTVTNTAIAGGKVGVGSRNNDVMFDNLIVTAVAPTPAPADTTAPNVSVTSPANGSTVSGNFNFNATATDNVSVSKVEFYIDGVLRGVDTSAPYTVAVDAAQLSNGTHSLTAKAFDGAGNEKTSGAVSVTIQNTTALPEDINQDGKVDILDFSLLRAKFGDTGSNLGREDINQDGKVDILDFSLLKAKWGKK